MAQQAFLTCFVLCMACLGVVRLYGSIEPAEWIMVAVMLSFSLSLVGLVGSLIWHIWS